MIGDAAGGGDGHLQATVDLVVANTLLATRFVSRDASGFVNTNGQLVVDDASLLKVYSRGLEHYFHIGLATIRGTSGVTASGRVDVALGDSRRLGATTVKLALPRTKGATPT